MTQFLCRRIAHAYYVGTRIDRATDMPDSKNLRWLEQYQQQESTTLDPNQPAANDADGWQQYRRWINKAPVPGSRRVGIDPTLYSWRSYRNWTEEVKRSWPEDVEND